MSTSTIPYLPKNSNQLIDGARYADYLGIIWEYNKETNNFRQVGIVQELPEVDSTQDGLVPPDIQIKLEDLKDKFGITLQNLPPYFKIGSIADVYYYLLKSSNNTIIFTIENNHELRVEINIHEILRHLTYMARKGDRGEPGDTGDPGYDALPDEMVCGEPTYSIKGNYSSFTEQKLLIEIPVKNINGEVISLRLFNTRPSEYTDNGVIINVDVPVSETTNSTDSFAITDLNYKIGSGSTATYANGVLKATIILTKGQFTDRWYFRALQRGERGDPGNAGKNFIDVIRTTLGTKVSYARPVVDLRIDELSGEVVFTRLPLTGSACVSRITIPGITEVDPGKPYKSNYLALEKTLNGCKKFYKWKLDTDVTDPSDLELPQWTPVPGCQVPDFYPEYAFDWVGYSDLAATNGVWASPDGVKRIKYPWIILNSEKPAEQDCNPCTDIT